MADATPFRFSLRSIFYVVLFIAMGFAFLPPWLNKNRHSIEFLVAAVFIITFGAIIAYVVGAVCGHSAMRFVQIPFVRILAWLALAFAVLSTCYLFWAHARWITAYFDDPLYPRSIPFPEEYLIDFHDWLDARNPPPPGSIKFHGEFDAVMEYLEIAILASVSMAFFMLGLVAPYLATILRCKMRGLIKRVG
jgi:hypothetical protein